MSLFSSKEKVPASVFLDERLNYFFSEEFLSTCGTSYENTTAVYPVMKKAHLEIFIKEITALHIELFGIAWLKSAPRKANLDWAIRKQGDERVKPLEEVVKAYNSSLPDAMRAGFGLFEGLAITFIHRLLPQEDIKSENTRELIEVYSSEFSALYSAMVVVIKNYRIF